MDTHKRFLAAMKGVHNPSPRVTAYINHYQAMIPVIQGNDESAADRAFDESATLWEALTQDERDTLMRIYREA